MRLSSTTYSNGLHSIYAVATDDAGNADGIGSRYFTISNAVPVELMSFSAEIEKEQVILNWQTATEVNNYGFEVQREFQESSIENQDKDHPSADGWETIGFIEGHGNSNSPKDYSFTDTDISVASKQLRYRLRQIDTDGSFEYSEIIEVDLSADEPTEFKLSQNYPNPFNPSTTIKYSLPVVETLRATSQCVTLKIYNILGQEVAILVNKEQTLGRYEVELKASHLNSGLYFYKLVSGQYSETKKMLLIK